MIVGEPGPGKVLIVTRRDGMRNAIEQTWTSAAAVEDWDERVWRDDWRQP